jgi:hypothetical protein
MYRSIIYLASFLIIFSFAKCKKDDSSGFSNKISLGTGIDITNAFNLSGEGSTFTQIGGSVIIYFRLESADDMNGETVILDFLTSSGSLINTITRPAAQSYGHIMVSSFEWLGSKGNFTVKAYLNPSTGKKLIASKDFTIQ